MSAEGRWSDPTWARAWEGVVLPGLDALGLPVDPAVEGSLRRYVEELLTWNRKVNLTAVVEPAELGEKHLLDSLAAMRVVAGAGSLVDLGAGAGLPGIPLAVALPALQVTLVDSVGKKVAFMKAAIARLGLAPRVRAVHVTAAGDPAREGLPQAEVVIARALAEPVRLLELARAYLVPGGRVVAMLGVPPAETSLEAAGRTVGLRLATLERYELLPSRAQRALAVFHVEPGTPSTG